MNKNTDNLHSPLSRFSLTHTNKQTSLTPSTNVRWTCDQVIITSPHCPGCLQVCINTLRHHLHCGCEYWCCSKKNKTKKTGPLGEMKSRGSWKHPPLYGHFFTCTGSITPVQKASRNMRCKARGFALRNFSFCIQKCFFFFLLLSFFSFKKSFKNKENEE